MTHIDEDKSGMNPLEGRFSLTIDGMTEYEYDHLKTAVADALQPAGARRLSRFFGGAMVVAIAMIGIAASIWVVAAILTNLPGR